jgi:hypothetical protein
LFACGVEYSVCTVAGIFVYTGIAVEANCFTCFMVVWRWQNASCCTFPTNYPDCGSDNSSCFVLVRGLPKCCKPQHNFVDIFAGPQHECLLLLGQQLLLPQEAACRAITLKLSPIFCVFQLHNTLLYQLLLYQLLVDRFIEDQFI